MYVTCSYMHVEFSHIHVATYVHVEFSHVAACTWSSHVATCMYVRTYLPTLLEIIL